MPTFAIEDLLKQGWHIFKKHMVFVWMILGTALLVSVIFNALGKAVEGQGILTLVVTLASIYVSLLIEVGVYRAFLDLVDKGSENPWKTLFSQSELLWRYLFAYILFSLGAVIGIVLLVAPGVYFILKYQYFGYLIVDKNLGVKDAFRESALLTDGVKWRLLGFMLAVVVLNILGALLLLVGLLVTVPVSVLASFLLYRRLSQRLEPVVAVSPAVPSPITTPSAPVSSSLSEAQTR